MEVEYAKKQKELEPKDVRYKLNLYPKKTFDTERKTYGTMVEFPEVRIFSFRKSRRILSSTYTLTKTNGRAATLTNQGYTGTLLLSQPTWRTLPRKKPESQRRKVEGRASGG